MTPNRLPLTLATCAVLTAALCSAPVVAIEPLAMPLDGSQAAVSYWHRIPRRVVTLTQTAYAVSADRLQQLTTTTTLQRLRDSQARTGVSLMTLWEFRGSTISLQAGRNGEPTLRWSSRAMHRGEATRGLFDTLMDRPPQDALREPTWRLASN